MAVGYGAYEPEPQTGDSMLAAASLNRCSFVALASGNGAPHSDRFGVASLGHIVTCLGLGLITKGF